MIIGITINNDNNNDTNPPTHTPKLNQKTGVSERSYDSL